jgi:hypothetical protein
MVSPGGSLSGALYAADTIVEHFAFPVLFCPRRCDVEFRSALETKFQSVQMRSSVLSPVVTVSIDIQGLQRLSTGVDFVASAIIILLCSDTI